MKIPDRGRKKWVSLMLPEHGKRLQALKEMEDEQEQPLLDEQQLERLDAILKISLQEKRAVRITFYQGKKLHQIQGRIKAYLPVHKALILEGETFPPIPFQEVVDMDLLDR